MSQAIPLLSDTELQALQPGTDEAGLGALKTTVGNLPLKAVDVQARVTGLSARTTLRQTFVNTFAEPLEATYVFPLPDRAAVTGFLMVIGERTVAGQLKERGEAREAYAAAIGQGHRAAMAEEDRPGVFTIQVGNLMPGDTATVILDLVGPLVCADGEATYRFPLVAAPRYIPGSPLADEPAGLGTVPDTTAVPDASRITPPVLLPGFPSPVRLSLAVELEAAGLPFGPVRSSLHAVIEEAGDGRRRVAVQPGERLNRDFVLRIGLAPASLTTSLAVCADADGSEAGTFALTLVPPALPATAVRPRDIVFALDRSGSMGGWKMVAARRAIAEMVETLTERDRFTIYAFDDVVERPARFPQSQLAAATDANRFHAAEWLGGIEARGGTEMQEPLSRGVALLAHPAAERERILMLVTDGQVGNEDQLLSALGPRIGRIRVYTVGIDSAVNVGFLNRLASVGRGACELVESEDRLQQAMGAIHRMIGVPVLTDLRFVPDGLGVDAETVVPGRMPDVFADVPLVVMGRYAGPGEGKLQLQGRLADGSPWETAIPTHRVDNEAITKSWARGRVRELEDRYAIGVADSDTLAEAITATSLTFGVLCRFTAYVAVDTAEAVNVGGQVHQVVQAVEMPSGWAAHTSQYRYSRQANSAPGVGSFLACEDAAMPMYAASPDDVRCDSEILPPPTKADCRRLAESLLERLRQAGDDEAEALSEMTDELEELAEGLDANGLVQEDADQLQSLVHTLEGLGVGEIQAMGLCRQVIAVLERIIGALKPQRPAKRGRRFWK